MLQAVVSSSARARLRAASDFVRQAGPAAEIVVIGATREAADGLPVLAIERGVVRPAPFHPGSARGGGTSGAAPAARGLSPSTPLGATPRGACGVRGGGALRPSTISSRWRSVRALARRRRCVSCVKPVWVRGSRAAGPGPTSRVCSTSTGVSSRRRASPTAPRCCTRPHAGARPSARRACRPARVAARRRRPLARGTRCRRRARRDVAGDADHRSDR